MNARDIECAVARLFDYRANIIVPNVSWGLGLRYECDMVILRSSGWAAEVEIKTTAADIKADWNKKWQHSSQLFKQLYFAVPQELVGNSNIPATAGIIGVKFETCSDFPGAAGYYAKICRAPKIRKTAKQLTPEQRQKLLHLGCMRIWSLKEKLNQQENGG